MTSALPFFILAILTLSSASELEESEEELDVIDKVVKEEEELLEIQTDIDEETFAKFLQVQHSGDVNRTDYIAISKKANIDSSVGEQIILRYKFLSDKYPQAVAASRAKKIAPQKISLLEDEEKKDQPPAHRRLIKKK